MFLAPDLSHSAWLSLCLFLSLCPGAAFLSDRRGELLQRNAANLVSWALFLMAIQQALVRTVSFSSRRTRASEPCRRGVSRLKLICRTSPSGLLGPWHPLLARARTHARSAPSNSPPPSHPFHLGPPSVARAHACAHCAASVRLMSISPPLGPPRIAGWHDIAYDGLSEWPFGGGGAADCCRGQGRCR